MKIELDDIKLASKTTDIKTRVTQETRSVYNINTTEKRTLVEYKVPGLEGNLFKDIGREPIRISFDGTLQGPLAKKNLEQIRKKFKAGKPVQFASDLTGATDVTKVLIEELITIDTLGNSTRFTYSIVLREYIEASAPSSSSQQETLVPSQKKQAKDAVDDKIDDALGSVNYITGKVLDAEGNPKKDVPVKITGDAGEIIVNTNEEGVYRYDNLEPGKYIITADAEGYEGTEKEVIIKPGREKA